MLRRYLQIFGREELAQLRDGVFYLLSTIGVRVDNEEILSLLEYMGAKINKISKVVRFPEKVLEKVIAKQRENTLRREKKDWEKNLITPAEMKTSLATYNFYYYDWPNRERRYPTENEFYDMIHLMDVMGTHVLPPVQNPNFNPRTADLETLAVVIQHAKNPACPPITYPEQMKYFAEIGQIYAGPEGKDRFIPAGNFIISPLVMDSMFCQRIMEKCKYRTSIGISTMPVSGTTAPVTPAGTIIQGAAEILGGWIVVTAIREDAELYGLICSGTSDMRTGKVWWVSPQSLLQDIGVHQLFREEFGCRVNTFPGWIDAKIPGWQAIYERIFRAMALGSTSVIGFSNAGLLDGGECFSPTQAMIDWQLDQGLIKFFQGVEIFDVTTVLNVWKEVGVGGNFLTVNHTLENFRKVLWAPEFLDHTCWKRNEEADKGNEKNLLERADQKWRQLLKQYQPPSLNQNMVKEIIKVVEKAKKEILNY
ncbi:trimethylamine methyltransferase family protein [Candidatus Calescamantes bacterium]|nr:trimethylamine methyltransferase family protein [Candidatus Calescamantes bacterium]